MPSHQVFTKGPGMDVGWSEFFAVKEPNKKSSPNQLVVGACGGGKKFQLVFPSV